jgi:hypothetical protein
MEQRGKCFRIHNFLITVDILMLQEKMTVDKVVVALLLVLVMVEAKRTLPRNILSLSGQVVLHEWFAPPSHFKVFYGTHFIPEDDVNLCQSQRMRPFIPTDDYVEECIRCMNDTQRPSNVWWSPLHAIEKMEVTIQPGFCLTPKDLRRQPVIGHYVCAEFEVCLLWFWPFVYSLRRISCLTGKEIN